MVGIHTIITFEAFSAPQEGAVIKHIFRLWIESPIVAFARISWFTRNFDKAVVQTEIMTNAVLPRGKTLSVIGKSFHNEFANAAQSQSLLRTLQNTHGNESNVAVWWLH